MRALVTPHVFPPSPFGVLWVPASKSHTIRRLLFASLAGGVSRIDGPLDSLDAQSCAAACRVLGARITEDRDGGVLRGWTVEGQTMEDRKDRAAGSSGPPGRIIDAGNSGTTLFLALAAAALGSSPVTFTGDEQIARRGAGPLLDALAGLGVRTGSAPGPGGKTGHTPITVCGPWKGGRVSLPCPTSQYLSALLMAAPLAPAGTITEIDVPLLNEKPYVEMTLSYLAAQGFYRGADGKFANGETAADGGNTEIPGMVTAAADFSFFRIRGGGAYRPLHGPVPGDFSSAAFPAAAAIISGGSLTLRGLDPADAQGDRVFFEYLSALGCEIRWDFSDAAGPSVTVSRRGPLKGGVFDLNATPDMLPVLAVLASCAEGETALVNAAHARIKETDRIAVMAAELNKLFGGAPGFRCEERPGGLAIQGCGFARRGESPGGHNSEQNNRHNNGKQNIGENPPGRIITLDGRGDHRVVMALACAALALPAGAAAEIAGAEAADVTYPGFLELLKARCYT